MASLLSKTRAVAGRVGSRSGFQQAALILASRRKFSNEPGTVHPRPISPHVEIYAFPTTALTSIANRGTGVGLSIGFFGAACVALTGNCDIPALVEGYKETVGFLVVPTKMIVGFPFIYHYAAGMRHLYWDKTAEGLTNEQAEMTSRALIAGTGLLTLAAAFTTI